MDLSPAPTAFSDGTAFPAGLSDSAAAEWMATRLNAPIPLAYGRHLVAGSPIFQHLDEATKKTTLFIALGLGEWDSIEVLWVNGLDVTNTAEYHFHPGTDGETGMEEEGTGLESQTRTPGTVTGGDAGPDGDTYDWSSPSNAAAEDGNLATATLPVPPGNTKSNWLKATNFGFSIPSGATIRGYKANLKRKQNSGTSAIYAAMKMLGVTGGLMKGDPYGVPWPGTLQFKYYGSSTDLWNATGASDTVVNNSAFGVGMVAQCTGAPGNGAVAGVDLESLTVYYEQAGAGSRNQKICSLFPAQYTPLTFSRTAYLSLLLDPDPGAPDAGFDVRGIYRTKRVRIFDSSGNPIDYAWSQNPLWQKLDLLIDYWIKPRALVNAALTADEKAKIDWPLLAAAAAYADELITVNGVEVPRFRSNVVFVNESDLNAALATLLAQCRGFLLQQDGKFKLNIDAPRSSIFTFNSSNVAEGSLSLAQRSTRDMVNRLVLKARDPQSGQGDHTKDFKPWQKNLDDEPQQDFAGRVISQDADFGAQDPERAERLGKYMLRRTLDLDGQVALRGIIDAGMVSPGDRVVGPAQQDFGSSADYEVIEVDDNPDGTHDFQLQKYDESIFSDTAEPQQAAEETNIPRTTQAVDDGQVLVTDSTSPSGVGTVSPQPSPAVEEISGNYTAQASDSGKTLYFNSSSPATLTLPASAPSSDWIIKVTNGGSGAVTIDRNGRTIDGAADDLVLNQNQGCSIQPDGLNYITVRGVGAEGFHVVGVSIDGGASAIVAPIVRRIQYPYADGAIIGWSVAGDPAGSLTVEIDKHASSPPPAAPSVPNTTTDKISASAPISMSSAESASGAASEVSTWAKAVAQWDSIQFNLTAASAIKWLSAYLLIQEN